MNEFDLRAFVDNLRATKPPYECPFVECGRIYKSFSGIQSHLANFKHQNEKNISDTKFGSISTSIAASRETVNWIQAQKTVEFELDGKPMRLNVLEPLEITFVDDSDEERSLKDAWQGFDRDGFNENGQKIQPPPIPQFRIVDEFAPSDTKTMPSSYLKFIERQPDEIDEEIEYDMDEEDCAWLKLINVIRTKTGLPHVSENTLEYLMDVFEKESHFRSTHSTDGQQQQQQMFDDDAVCCVCNDGECDNSNAILFCDMCNLAVHQECYGVPYIPEGQWLCRRCQLSPSQAVDCVLCPNRGGAFKQTSDGRWAHVVCALWVPEVQFANTVFLEPIEGFEHVPAARWKLNCYVCKQKKNAGACIQCHKPSCYTAFHVTCAISAGLYMKIEPIKDMSPGGSTFTVKKTAFCDAHAPSCDSGNHSAAGDDENEDRTVNESRREESKLKMRKARKILAQRRNSSPVISVPVISRCRLDGLARELKLRGKQEFLERLLVYWTLKRQSRFGVPLLRRLQINNQKHKANKEGEEPQAMTAQLSYWRRLRQDLEKARLLVELIRKREQKKKDITIVASNYAETLRGGDDQQQAEDKGRFLVEVIDNLLAKDEMKIFAAPVSEDDVPGYRKFVKDPMDLGSMRNKALTGEYSDVSDVQTDFNLMISNCLMFNKKNPYFLKYAQKIKRACASIFKDASESLTTVEMEDEEEVEDSTQTRELMSHRSTPKVEEKSSDDDDDTRPLSALVVDEGAGVVRSRTNSSAKQRPKKKSRRNLNVKESKKERNSPERLNDSSSCTSKRSAVEATKNSKSNSTPSRTRESFRTFRAIDPTSPNGVSELSANEIDSATEKEESDVDVPRARLRSASDSAAVLTLEHLDMVWAQAPDYSWPVPAVIIDPKVPASSYVSSVAEVKPPMEVLNVQHSFKDFRYLVMLFDGKKWRWLERGCVEPLFLDTGDDRRKLRIPSKLSDRTSLIKAYDAAVAFRCGNTGEDPDDFRLDESDANSSGD